MKVLLQKNVMHLGKIGDLVEVKPGYARNYLLPHGLAVQPTAANLKAVEVAKQKYLEELAKKRQELAAKATVVDGKAVTIEARANEEGHLYGSIGAAQIVAELSEQNVFIEPEFVVLEHSIREVGQYDVQLDFGAEVTATVSVTIKSTEVEVADELMTEPVEESADEADESADEDAYDDQ